MFEKIFKLFNSLLKVESELRLFTNYLIIKAEKKKMRKIFSF